MGMNITGRIPKTLTKNNGNPIDEHERVYFLHFAITKGNFPIISKERKEVCMMEESGSIIHFHYNTEMGCTYDLNDSTLTGIV